MAMNRIFEFCAIRLKNGRYYITITSDMASMADYARDAHPAAPQEWQQFMDNKLHSINADENTQPVVSKAMAATDMATDTIIANAGAGGGDKPEASAKPPLPTAPQAAAVPAPELPKRGQDRQKNRAPANAREKGKDQHDSDAVKRFREGSALAAMLEDGKAITLYTAPPDDMVANDAVPFSLGIVTEYQQPTDQFNVRDQGLSGPFSIAYDRPFPARPAEEIRPTLSAVDAAVIARVFMLAKLSVTRLQMRAILVDLNNRLADIDEACERARTDRFAACKLLARFEAEEQDHDAPAAHALMRAQRYVQIKCEDWLARATKWLRDWVRKETLFSLVLTAGFLIFALLWIWTPYITKSAHAPAHSNLLAALLFVGMLFVLLNTLNLRSVKDRLIEYTHQMAVEKLNAILATLAQTNANVTSGNVSSENAGPRDKHDKGDDTIAVVPELLLQRMEARLKMRDRLSSIEETIRARQIHLVTHANHIHEHRDRMRRSIAAAGGCVFVGFFTYEVGESVMKYIHLAHHQDPYTMLYWLVTHDAAHLPADVDCPAGFTPGGTTATAVTQPQPAAHFDCHFYSPELQAHSLLLTIALIASLLTALIAMRKPPAEQTGGLGHH